MEGFKEGDVVQLKSGSPAMTICEVYNGGSFVYCTWYDFSNNSWNKEVSFPAIVLVKTQVEADFVYTEFEDEII